MGERIRLKLVKDTHVGFKTDVLLSLAGKIFRKYGSKSISGRDLALVVIFVDSKKMREINNRYRHKNVPTDVLSFSYLEDLNRNSRKGKDFREDNLVGEIYIDTDVLRKQAKEYRHPFYKELEVLFTHGLLHILGYDHIKAADRLKMVKAEEDLFGDKSGMLIR